MHCPCQWYDAQAGNRHSFVRRLPPVRMYNGLDSTLSMSSVSGTTLNDDQMMLCSKVSCWIKMLTYRHFKLILDEAISTKIHPLCGFQPNNAGKLSTNPSNAHGCWRFSGWDAQVTDIFLVWFPTQYFVVELLSPTCFCLNGNYCYSVEAKCPKETQSWSLFRYGREQASRWTWSWDQTNILNPAKNKEKLLNWSNSSQLSGCKMTWQVEILEAKWETEI